MVTNSTKALNSIDGALSFISDLGAIQNWFSVIAANLENVSQSVL